MTAGNRAKPYFSIITARLSAKGTKTMISAQENELLTRVGPGTPMGRMMRRYWLPVCTSEQLPKPDCDPLRVRLLGERFVAFRDTRSEEHTSELQSHVNLV